MKGVVMIVMFAAVVQGAVLEGQVYNLNLELIDNAIIRIDTKPQQQVIARNGEFAIEVPSGSYQVVAEQVINGEIIALFEENITVAQEGTFRLDMILFPLIELEADEELELELNEFEEPRALNGVWIAGALVVLVGVIIGYKLRSIKRFGQGDEVSDQVLAVIKEHGGRISQKDLRKALPWSEAKVSLVVTELENNGNIEKIKKGRGNIIIGKQ